MDKLVKILTSILLKKGMIEEFTNAYIKSASDEEYVKYIFNMMLTLNYNLKKTTNPKCARASAIMLQIGELHFKSSSQSIAGCMKALIFCTKSITLAPNMSMELACAYNLRSIILQHIGLNLECLNDIDRVLDLDLLDDLRGIYERKMKCLIKLGNESKKNKIEKIQSWIDDLSIDNAMKENLSLKLTEFLSKRKDLFKKDKSRTILLEPLLPVMQPCNNEIPCASDAVTLQYKENYGRHIVATRDISINEVIAVQKPYAALLNKDHLLTHCSNCLKECWANIPCDHCTYVMFCSKECKDIMWNKCHDIECVLLPSLIRSTNFNITLLSVRLVILAIRESGGLQELRTIMNEVDQHNGI